MSNALDILKKLLESAEDLLDVDKCGEFIDFEHLLCNCCQTTIVEKEAFDDFVKQIKNAKTFVKTKKDENPRLTVGCRCAFGENSNWAKNWFGVGRHCIIKERSNGSFGVLVLSKGFTGKLAKNLSIYDNSVAWVDEDELELIDRNYSANLDFLDWFQEVKEDICGTCRKAFYDHKKEKCPNPDCLSNN